MFYRCGCGLGDVGGGNDQMGVGCVCPYLYLCHLSVTHTTEQAQHQLNMTFVLILKVTDTWRLVLRVVILIIILVATTEETLHNNKNKTKIRICLLINLLVLPFINSFIHLFVHLSEGWTIDLVNQLASCMVSS